MFVTAAHVATGARVAVRTRGRGAECDVLMRYEDDDLAVVADRPEIDAVPLPVAELVAAGEATVLAGYPLGWNEDEALVASGHVGGVRREAEELWLNADSSWGHSGGPAVAMIDGVPCVVGIILGAAGEAHERLRQLQGQLAHRRSEVVSLEQQARGGRTHVIGGERAFDNPWPVVKALAGVAQDLVRLLDATRAAVEEHFRTGFVRARAPEAVRRRLGFER